MVSTIYGSGSWLGIVRSGTVVVVEGSTSPAVVRHLWDALADQPGIHGVLNEVSQQFGTGLTGLPPFAIVLQDDRLHAIVRGDISVDVHLSGGTETIHGRDVTTWSERSLPLADSFELTVGVQDAGIEPLPLGEGVVRLQSIGVDFAGSEGLSLGKHDAGLPASAPIAAQLPGAVADVAVPEAAEPVFAGYEAANSEEFAESDNADALDVDAVEASTAGSAVSDSSAASEAESPIDSSGGSSDSFGGEAEPDIAVEEEDTLTSFAKAAEAADAEWNAQLAPLDSPSALDAMDLDSLNLESLNLESLEHEPLDGNSIQLDAPELSVPVDDAATETEHGEVHGDVDLSQTLMPGFMVDGERDGAHDEQAATVADDSAAETAAVPAQLESEGAEDDGFTINYDYLFGATTMAQSVEAAAVRLDEEGKPITASASALPPMPPLPPGAGAALNDALTNGVAAPEDPREDAQEAAGVSAVSAGDSAARPQESAAAAAAESLMIDSVPWGRPEAQASEQAWSQDSEPAVEPYDPDHDGHTIMRSDVEQSGPGANAEQLESKPPTGPMVLARMCPNGHANPPTRSACHDCGAAINSEPREVGRPRLGTMHISTGEVVELDHSLIIGRQPSVSRVMGGAMPRLVQVTSSNGDISRSHVEVRLDGWEVLLVDLKATNGTVLVREGQAPRRLSQGEEAILLNGDIAELGDGVSLLFDGLL